MLEVRNLKKEYRTKNGVITKALDDVSLTFAETGMVFILGKSGSGKSTLLNVCGGLDRADSGEIIIKGKSSKDFTGPDFDSYRNTYVGFVFQEYNILDEFTIEDNIALALELQNKKRDKAVIEQILADVDMSEFASRKPNTLSGGQKQRVAIARALVKEPEIIMADEPTGALDSKTGQQVFDTLKKLSKKKLVIVVSHDRDFAEQYADRIIELKDGKILSDQTRLETDVEQNNVRFFGTDTVCITSGTDITDDDLQQIKKFLNKSNGSAVISTSRERIAEMKQDLPELSTGSFENIKEQPKSKEYPQQKLIRSHLPARHAIKMGASGLASKPVRLVFTLLLSIVAFILFGLASTLMLFDAKDVTVSTFMNSDYDNIILGKAYYETVKVYNENNEYMYGYQNKVSTYYTMEEYKALRYKYSGAIAAIDYPCSITNLGIGVLESNYYTSRLDGFIIADESLNMLAGRLPAANDEIAISGYMFDGIRLESSKLTYRKDGEDVDTLAVITDYDSILYTDAKPITLELAGQKFKIVGVYEGMGELSQYAGMKKAAQEGLAFSGNNSLVYSWQVERANGNYARVAITQELAEIIGAEIAADANHSDEMDVYDYFNNISSAFSYGYYDTDLGDYSAGSIDYIAKYASDSGLELLPLYGLDGARIDSLGTEAVGLHYEYLLIVLSSTLRDIWADVNYGETYEAIYSGGEKAYENYKEQNSEPNEEKFDGDLNAYYKALFAYDEAAEHARLVGEAEAAGKYGKLFWYRINQLDKLKADYDAQNPMPEIIWDSTSGGYTSEMIEWLDNRGSTAYFSINMFINTLDNVIYGEYDDTPEFRAAVFKLIEDGMEMLSDTGYELKLFSNGYNDIYKADIGGVYFANNSFRYCVYLSDELYDMLYSMLSYDSGYWRSESQTKYVVPDGAFIKAVYIPYQVKTSSMTGALIDMTNVRDYDDSTTEILNYVMSEIELLVEIAKMMGTVFLVAGLVLALFAFLLMFNFISASISAKKKEIGILRAIGARTADVFKIFFSEAAIIALICFVVSALGSFGLSILMNNILTSGTIINVSVFIFGPLSALCVFAIAVVTAVIATVIPVSLYSRKPPVASIRAL